MHLNSTNPLLQKDLVELRLKFDSHCDKAKEATKEAINLLSLDCDSVGDNLMAAADRNAVQEKLTNLIKKGLAELMLLRRMERLEK